MGESARGIRRRVCGSVRTSRVRSIFALVIMLAAPAFSQAQPTLHVSGYLKDLLVRSTSFFSDESYILNVTRSRVRFDATLNDAFQANVWFDTELFAGSFLDTPDYALSRLVRRETYFDLDWTVADEPDFLLQQEFFRASVSAYHRGARLVVGRQRVGWGTGFVWTPTDLLNPVSPTSLERDEKGGVDAVFAEIPIGTRGHVEAAVVPGRSRDATAAAGRFGGNVGEFDWNLMGGYFREDVVVGGDFAGYVGNAGLRGEVTVTIPDVGDAYVRATVNSDYSFWDHYYGLVELHFNGRGARDKGNYRLADLASGSAFTLAKDYGAVILSRTISPLVSGSLYAIFNLDDRSGLVGPSIGWWMLQDVEMTGSAYLFLGESDSEFGGLGNAYFFSLQYYF